MTTSLLHPEFYGPLVVASTGFHLVHVKCSFVIIELHSLLFLCVLINWNTGTNQLGTQNDLFSIE